MTKLSGIRITYTGLLSFVGGLISIVTGLIFTLIITRTLSPEQYGSWGLINVLLLYVLMIGPIVSYWTTREIARDTHSGKTSVLASFGLSVIATIVYLFIAYVMSIYSNVQVDILLMGGILIPAMFVNSILSAINLGSKPHVVVYGTVAYGLTSIPFAFLFVNVLEIGIIGLLFSLLISYCVSIVIQFYYSYDKLKNNFNSKYIKKYLKYFWIPAYPSIAIIVAGLDISIFTILMGSVIGLAYWIAASVLPSMISHTGLISRGVYAKLLGSDKKDYLEDNIIHVLFFGILLTSVVITFSRAGLYVLNPIYEFVFPVVMILAVDGFFTVLTNIFTQSLAGIENVDKDNTSTFKDYVKSKLFLPPTLRLIQTCTYVVILTTGILFLKNYSVSDVNLLIFWASIAVLTQIPLSLYLYVLVKRNLMIKIKRKHILNYVLSAVIVFGLTYFISDHFLYYTNNLVVFLPNLLAYVIVSILGYFVVTSLLDNKAKYLLKSILKEIKEKSVRSK
ncbi:MAG: hypothetical protein AABX32_05740 [Nanoarchaeota archaeon]